MHRRALSAIVLTAALAACGGSGTPAASSGPGGGTQAPAATGAPGATEAPTGATEAPTAATGGGSGGAAIGTPCQRVTVEQVQAAFGGTVGPGVEGDTDCTFDVSGEVKAGTVTPPNPFLVAVTWQDEFTPFDTAKTVFGDGITAADGVGTEAYFAIGGLHAKVPTGELVVTAIGVGELDEATLDACKIALAKALVAGG